MHQYPNVPGQETQFWVSWDCYVSAAGCLQCTSAFMGYYSCCLQQNHSALNGKRKEVMAEHLQQPRLGPAGICYKGTWSTTLLIF